MKHKLLMAHLKEDEPFGKVIADVSVIEFQKRGLMHAQIILFLHEIPKKNSKIRSELMQFCQRKFRLDKILFFEKQLSST